MQSSFPLMKAARTGVVTVSKANTAATMQILLVMAFPLGS
jgi:hypothetical protein